MTPAHRAVLEAGEVTIEGRFTNSSNATLLVNVEFEGISVKAVYKPEAGERPLWDFPAGLWRREVAAFELSELLGLRIVPLTIARSDAPAGPGSLQAYVDEDLEHHYFTLRDDPAHLDRLRDLAAFDVLANNADRKSGHVLLAEGSLWAIDHGLCFHEDDKLRTVIWDFAGDEVRSELLEAALGIADAPPASLTEVLSEAEIEALVRRCLTLAADGRLPIPDEDGMYPPYPWPLI